MPRNPQGHVPQRELTPVLNEALPPSLGFHHRALAGYVQGRLWAPGLGPQDLPPGSPPGHRSQVLCSSAQNWPLGVRVELHEENPALQGTERPFPPTHPARGKWLLLQWPPGKADPRGPLGRRGLRVAYLTTELHSSGQWLAFWSPSSLHRQ